MENQKEKHYKKKIVVLDIQYVNQNKELGTIFHIWHTTYHIPHTGTGTTFSKANRRKKRSLPNEVEEMRNR